MAVNNKLSMTTILLIIVTTIMVGYIIFLLLPSENLFGTTMTKIINVILLPVPESLRTNITNDFKYTVDNWNEIIKNMWKTIAVKIVKYLPTDIVKSIIDSVPRDLIDDDRCKRKPSGKFIVNNTDNLPWDDPVDKCGINKGTLDDIDLNERVKSANPKIILY